MKCLGLFLVYVTIFMQIDVLLTYQKLMCHSVSYEFFPKLVFLIRSLVYDSTLRPLHPAH
jgi:hypothetical protein